jgi:chorismate mutase/prephenate dehydratase
VVCAVAPDPSGDDRSLLGVETAVGISRARLSDALRAAGFRVGWVVLHQEPGTDSVQALIDVEGYVTDADPRLEAIPWIGRPPLVLGAYAVPVAGQAV